MLESHTEELRPDFTLERKNERLRQRVSRLLESKKIKQGALAKLCGIEPGTLSAFMTRRTDTMRPKAMLELERHATSLEIGERTLHWRSREQSMESGNKSWLTAPAGDFPELDSVRKRVASALADDDPFYADRLRDTPVKRLLFIDSLIDCE